jgi:ABC-2 type transport system permease protein
MSTMAQDMTPIVPARDRELRNRASPSQNISNTLTMAYRGLIKIRRTPSSSSTSPSSRSCSP